MDDTEGAVTALPKDNKFTDGESESLQFSSSEERHLLRLFDICILPPLTFMYLCNALDKGNVGNAKTDGWDHDLGLVGNQYYLLVMIFYVFGTPISLLVKRFSAARVLPLMMMGFIFAIRFFLGIFESAMLPGVVFYLSTFYKRSELASRVGLFYAAAAIAGAFSGLIAFGVFQIKNTKYHGWQYLFWIEGASTCTFAIFAYFWLPRSPSTWAFLTERQKAIARSRILADSSVTSPLYWLWAVISLSLGVPLASVNNFLPQIVASLGYSTIKTNLYTVAPNIVGTVSLLVLTFSSDYFLERSIHICIPLATTLVGFIVLGSIDVVVHRGVAYFACFLLTMGASAPSVLVATWYNNNTPQESRRAVVTAVMVAIANASGLISTNVFREQDEPKYIPGTQQTFPLAKLPIELTASTGIWMRLENRRRNKAQGVSDNFTAADVHTESLGDGHKSPEFRYMY
ncbi:major facilitator superfamily domain-containing protein [Desarmillaria tabescens]|uniref:Major facilitator superfamily domain-containing protein n=1 Tax=Armillaria tabescens TaxID=1929756 RepID=A0AA39NG77_ARMTA|nr:major facilitator superfamily domain-containing protein [Desarmillaria tabescens]KAK0465061.1 major facilitator superfamily domain-containing protein [Desarmillaria tabescens]